MKTVFKNCKVVKDKVFDGEVYVEDGIIKDVANKVNVLNVDEIIDCHGYYLFPGMIDIHLHGSYGYDFINGPDDIVGLGLPKEGTTSYLASLTVVSHKDTLKLLDEFSKFKSSKQSANFIGVHLEGPYLSLEKKALMDPTYLRDADQKELDEMISYPIAKMMTIAPERDGALDLIKNNHHKINFMIGHTACREEEATKALEYGAKGFTHLYNAMSQHTHRNPGAVTSALNSNAYCELICDGNHVDKAVIKATYRTLGKDHIILITDAMHGKGMEDGDYLFSNMWCRKIKDKVRVIESGIFAGSVITQNDAIKYMRQFTNCSVSDLAKMASKNPADLFNLNKGSIEIGKDADIILLDEELDVKETYIAGIKVY